MPSPETRVLIFAKAPVPGQSKTRLEPVLGKEGAAQLSEQLLNRTIEMLIASQLVPMTHLELWCAPDIGHPVFQQAASQHGLALHQQLGEDLGERMSRAADQALQRAESVILLGTDCPVMTPAYINDAIEQLDAAVPVVLGPAEDGGYLLLGLRQSLPEIFQGVAWGSGKVLGQTRERLSQLGVRCTELKSLWDLDRPEDLERLKEELPDFARNLWPFLDHPVQSPA